MYESHIRSVVKGITWRVIASLTTMGLVFAFTGDVVLMLGVGALEVIAKITFYYLHERAWGRVAWGTVRG
jgi:adenylylsulfate kinase